MLVDHFMILIRFVEMRSMPSRRARFATGRPCSVPA